LVGTPWSWYLCFGYIQAAREQAEKGSMVEAAGTSPSVPVPHPTSASPRPPTGLSAFNSQPLGATASAPSPTPITRNAISPATGMGTQYGPLHFTCFQFQEKFPCGLWVMRVSGICGHDRGKFFFYILWASKSLQ
jgi:hypothetical protein